MPSNTLQPLQQDPQYSTESLVRGMDFSARLSPTSDTLTGTPTVTSSVFSGTDPNPQAILAGSPSLSSNNMQILQRVSGEPGGEIHPAHEGLRAVLGILLERLERV